MTEYLTTTEAAKRIGAGKSLIQARCKDGSHPAIKVGSDYRIATEDLEDWVKHRPAMLHSPVSKATSDLYGEIAAWLTFLERVRGLSPVTAKTHHKHLRCYLKRLSTCGGEALNSSLLFDRTTLIAAFTAIPAHSYALKLNIYNALLSFGRFLADEGKLDDTAIANVKPLKPRRTVEPRRTHLKAQDVPRLFDVILTFKRAPVENAAIAAIFGVMVYSGLRISEVCSLRTGDVDLDARIISVRHGKGGKDRRVGISSALLPYLKGYVANRPQGANAFFVHQDRTPWDQNRITKRMQLVARRMNVDITCHGLRRTFATLASSRGYSTNHIRIALGHANLQTTQAYLRTSEAEVVESMKGW